MFSRSRRIRPRHTSLPSGPQCTVPDSQHLSAEYRWLQLNTGSLISLTTGQSWFDIVSMKSIWLSLPNGWPSTVGLLIFVRLDNHTGLGLTWCSVWTLWMGVCQIDWCMAPLGIPGVTWSRGSGCVSTMWCSACRCWSRANCQGTVQIFLRSGLSN